MRQLARLLAFAACCALPASLQAAASSGQEFQLDATHRQALVRLPLPSGADAAAARLVVALNSVDAPEGGFGYIRLTALCKDDREAWHAAISPYSPDRDGRFLHGLRNPEAEACTPDRLQLQLIGRGDSEQLPSVRGYVTVE